MFKSARKYGRQIVGGVGVATAGVGSAFAAVPTEVTTALTGAAVDVAAVAGLALLVYLAPKAIKWLRGGL